MKAIILLVLAPAEGAKRFSNIAIVEHNPTVSVPPEVTNVFETELKKGLYASGSFSEGQELKLFYTFISHEEGNRLARWFWAGLGNSGEASITIQITYKDMNDIELAKTQVEGRIGSGFLGGSINEAILKAAQDVSEFTVTNFATQ